MPTLTQTCLTLRSRTEPPLFCLQTRTLTPSPSDLILKVLCFSVDPVMKFFLAGAKTYFQVVQIGDIFNCFAVGQVTQGNEDYPVGTYMFGNLGTCDVLVMDQGRLGQCFPVPKQLVEMYGADRFLYLINNGLAAYAGYQVMGPKQGETVVVSTASGATGLVLCQLLKKHGCKVIALTSPHKFSIVQPYSDITVDYKDTKYLGQVLKSNKFQYYFDNVGQHLLDMMIKYIQPNGRIALCGAIANYNDYKSRGITNVGMLISKRLTLTGITFSSMVPKIYPAFQQFQGMELPIKQIAMPQFQEYLGELLKSSNSIVGKIIIKP